MQPLAQNGYTAQEVEDVLRGVRGPRKLSFRYDLLDRDNKYLRRLDNVVSGSVSYSLLSDIKRTARFVIRDDGTPINYLSDRIQPWVRLEMPRVDEDYDDTVGRLPGPPLLRYKLDDPAGLRVANEILTEPTQVEIPGTEPAAFVGSREVLANADSITVPLPDGWEPGQLAVLAVNVNDDEEVVTPPAGWTALDSGPVETGSMEVLVAWRVLEEGDSDPTVTVTAQQKIAGAVAVYAGFDPDGPIAAVGTRGTRSSSSTTVEAGSVTTTAPNQRVVAIFGEKSSTATETVMPTGWERRAEQFGSGAGATSITIADQVAAEPGATGTVAVEYDAASGSGYGLLVVISNEPTTIQGDVGDGVASSASMMGAFPLLDDGSGYRFDSEALDYIEIPNAGDFLNGLPEFTLSLWFRPETQGDFRWLVDASDAQFEGLSVLRGSGNDIRVILPLASGQFINAVTPQGSAGVGQSYHLVVTWASGRQMRVYLNGVRQQLALGGFGPESAPLNSNGLLSHTGPLQIGKWLADDVTSDYFFHGRMDDILFARAYLDDDDVAALYYSGLREGKYSKAGQNYVEWPQGVFLLTSPTRTADGAITREVEAYDPLQEWADDLVTDRFTATAGDRYTDVISGILGPAKKNITPSPLELPADREWEPGTSKLSIINDLCTAINYEAMFADEWGTLVIRPYRSPSERPAEFDYRDNAVSVTLPTASLTADLFSVPNHWVLVVSDADREPLRAEYVNDNPASPTSTISRGRTITDFRTDAEAADQETLDDLVLRIAAEASQIYESVDFETVLMPIHSHGDVIRFAYDGLADAAYQEVNWELPLEAGATMRHTVRRIVQL